METGSVEGLNPRQDMKLMGISAPASDRGKEPLHLWLLAEFCGYQLRIVAFDSEGIVAGSKPQRTRKIGEACEQWPIA